MNLSPSETDRHSLNTRVVIVGAGPIGLELAVALKARGIAFEILDAGVIGHTIAWWAPQTRWFSSNERIAIAGVPLLTTDQSKATREEYLTYLRSVVAQFDIQVRCHQRVTDIQRSDDGFVVTSESSNAGLAIECSEVVLAVGGLDHPRRLDIPGADLPHVDGYLREPHRYCGQNVMIIGGRNSAAEAALRLHHVGAHVSLSYRGNELPSDHIKYWLYPELQGLIRAGRIAAYFNTQPVQITPSHVVLTSPDGEQSVAADHVLSLIGYVQDKSLFRTAKVELTGDSERPRVDEESLETSVPGLYVAGTAIAGTQSSHYKIFLENCHDHVDRIVAHIAGEKVAERSREYRLNAEAAPES